MHPTTITKKGSCEDHEYCIATYTLTSCTPLADEARMISVLEAQGLSESQVEDAIQDMKDQGLL